MAGKVPREIERAWTVGLLVCKQRKVRWFQLCCVQQKYGVLKLRKKMGEYIRNNVAVEYEREKSRFKDGHEFEREQSSGKEIERMWRCRT